MSAPLPAEAPLRSESATARKQRAVLEAAGDLFLEEGFAAVSMEAVARRAGVSKATLYAYFPGKDALFGAVVARRCTMMMESSRAVADHEAPLPQVLRTLGRFWLRFLTSQRSLSIYRTVMAEGMRFPDLARAFYEAGPAQGLAWTTEWIAEEQRRGRLRAEVNPHTMAVQFFALLRGELYLQVALGLRGEPDEAEIAAAVEPMVEVLLRAFATA